MKITRLFKDYFAYSSIMLLELPGLSNVILVSENSLDEEEVTVYHEGVRIVNSTCFSLSYDVYFKCIYKYTFILSLQKDAYFRRLSK